MLSSYASWLCLYTAAPKATLKVLAFALALHPVARKVANPLRTAIATEPFCHASEYQLNAGLLGALQGIRQPPAKPRTHYG